MCRRGSQAHESEMVVKYSLFLGAMIVLSPQYADDPTLVNQSKTRTQRCCVAVSYLTAGSCASSSGNFDILGETLWPSDEASRYFAKVIFFN